MMRSSFSMKVLLLHLTLFLILKAVGRPTVLYTSTSISAKVPPSGSLAGGTIVYIYGTNFSPDPSLISIFFGTYPCNLQAGSSSSSMLACITTPATSSSQYNLPLTINIQGQTPLKCSSNNCVFSYSNWLTPVVHELVPKTVKNEDLLNIFGLHRITDPGDGRSSSVGEIKSLLINGYTCSIIDVIQQESINGNSRDYIACKVISGDQAGEYNFTENVASGTANSSVRSYSQSYLTNRIYQVRLVGEITNEFSHQGGYNGQKLALAMTGESSDPSKYTCQIAGQSCSISSVDSSINMVYVEVPKYDSSNTNFDILTKEDSDSSNQMNPYLGSNGFMYSRYSLDITLTLQQWVDYFRAGIININVIQPPTIRTQLGSSEIYGDSYVEYMNGYLYIPSSGMYSFYGLVDDSLIVNLATFQNNSNPANMQTIIQLDSYINDHFNPYVSGSTPAYTRNFTKPGYYYMEVVSINNWGSGYFKVMMEAPNKTANAPANPTWQVDYFSIKQGDLKPEIINVTVKNTGIGSSPFHLYYFTQNSAGGLSLQQSSNIYANASAAAFLNAINGGLYVLSTYSPTVTLRMYDVQKVQTLSSSNAVYYEYSIIISRYRDTKAATTVLPFTETAFHGTSIVISAAQSHSPPIKGTYKLVINNNPVGLSNGTSFSIFNIPYDTDAGSLSSAFNNIYKSSEVEVKQLMNTYTQDSIEFVVLYFGVPSTFEIKFDVTGLTGGATNLFNTNYTVVRKYSNRSLYDPIPFQFLRTAVDSPQLYLTVNSIPVVCRNCAYKFNQTLSVEVTSASLSGQSISFTLSNPNSVTFSLSDISVSFLGVACGINTGDISSFSCSFATDSKGNSLIPAGKGIPVVHIKGIGYAITTSLTNITVSVTLTGFSPSIAGPQGMVAGSITGSGFPLSNSNNQIQISLCGNLVQTFNSITNTKIDFLVPPQGSSCSNPSSVSFNSQSFPLSFSYESTISPLVSNLSLSSSSPILKKDLQITGSNFLPTASIQVFLYDTQGVQQYELTVVSSTSTVINCILGGGKTGSYYVRVMNNAPTGAALSFASPASFFQYAIFVDTVSPVSGPMGGGYNITITGKNFAGSDSTNVLIGDASDNICTILSINSTVIICKMPFMDPSYNSGSPVNVAVTGRAIEESLCSGTCVFTYDASVSNNVTVLSTSIFSVGDVVTVTGFNLSGATAYVGGVLASTTAVTDNNITFVYPALAQGDYYIQILTSNGYAYPPLPTTTNTWLVNGISRSSGAYTGHILTVAGNGLTTTLNDGNVFTMICPTGGSFTLKRISASASVHSFEVPRNPGIADQYCSINITQGLYFRVYGYSYSGYHTNVTNATLTSAGDNIFLVTKTNSTSTIFQSAWAEVLDTKGNPTTSVYPLTITSLNSSTYRLSSSINYLPAGYLRIRVHSKISGYSTLSGQNITILMPSTPTGVAKSVSYVGGTNLTLTGSGFVNITPTNNRLTVCGMKAKVVSATSSSLTFTVPPLITQQTQSLYSLGQPATISGSPFGDTTANINLAVDSNTNTFYNSDSSSSCYVGVDFGVDTMANISSISYMGNPNWAITSNMLTGAVFEGSNDQSSWSTIFTIDNTVHMGWNYWPNPNPATVVYRYIRFRHNSTSQCQLAELSFVGQVYSTFAVNPSGVTTCNVQLILPNQTLQLTTAQIQYSAALTATVQSITPPFGPSIGGTVIQIQGKNFASNPQVTIDEIACSVISSNDTFISCTTGLRASPPSQGNSFVVATNGNPAILACDPYLYIDRWSAQSTWGGQALPRAGDSVYVPAGMTLLVDVSTPKLYSVIVDGGSIFFSDEKDMTFDASYFLLNKGQFRAGTPSSPYQHKLTFTLYGGYYDKQLPTFGNKMIGCKNCKFNMHGVPRHPTWTDLNATIQPGQSTLKLVEAVDWNVGESIAVASSSFNHYESQQKIIASKSADNKTLNVTTPFSFKHFAGIQTYGGKDFYMRAEVALLTRNIVMQGDQSSNTTRYGSHLMFNGKVATGLDAKLSYSEFRNCGQPTIVGRYCTHFHMAGEVPNSFVRGISVHNSFARVLTIHGTHYLLVEKNVGYRVEGHNIFIEDGIETKNVIQDNLMISSITSFVMLQSDITVASYWITNPFNTVIRNRAAGGDFYGFWYEIKAHPDGPSATYDVCPTGMQLGLSRDNIAHSNIRFGLRIFRLSAHKYPCKQPQDENLIDPYSANPAIESRFTNYTLWKNQECGFLGEELGYTTVEDFKTIDSKKGGMQFHKTNYTKELVVANNSVIVGYSQGNGPVDVDTEYANARGLIAARTDGLLVKNVQFFNFGATMTPLQSCSECYDFRLWVTGGKTTFFENITYTNILGNYIFWQKWRREIFMDLDGSLTAPIAQSLNLGAQSKGSVTPYRASLIVPTHCHIIANLWDNSIYCDQTQTLRGILFTNAIPTLDFTAIDIRVRLLSQPNENFLEVNLTNSDFSLEPSIVIKKMSMDIPHSWAMPFATGNYYNVHWKWGIDFTHLAIAPSRLWSSSDAVVLRFNYSDYRELYNIGKWYQQSLQLPYITGSDSLTDPTTCKNGDYYHDANNSYLFVCVSGRNKTIREWIDVNGARCLNACPEDIIGVNREDFTRLWSNVSNWPNNVLPQAGANVTINDTWNMILDCETPIFNYVQVRGYLIFDQSKDILFQAHYIWVKGKIKIGSKATPYVYNATIVLHGEKDSPYMVVDADASGNKMMVVTGGLEFYGLVTDNIWNRLTAITKPGATSITVADASGWKAGNQLVIGASYAGTDECENVTITSINGNTITFTPPLVYEHYGDTSTTISNSVATLDTRSAVGLLSRNIRITKGPDANGWGCRVLVYSFYSMPEISQNSPISTPTIETGYVIFDGVQLDRCGQYDTSYAGLRIQKLGSLKNTSVITSITRSSAHNCVGMCVYIDTSNNITFDNNVFFWARKFLVIVFTVDNYNFTNNLLTEARNRSELNLAGTLTVDDVACYEQFTQIDHANAKISVTKNFAQGCQGQGFVFPFSPCTYLDNYRFAGNTAGSCVVAFMIDRLAGQQCIGSSGLIGYSSQIGLMANPPGSQTQLIHQKMFFTDCGRGITLRYAHETDENTLYLKDSYFAGYSRPNCASCYSQKTIKYCQGGYAVRMFSATLTGETFPLVKENTVFDVICTQQSFDFKSFFNNVVFENYRYNNPTIPFCSSMSVFKRHNLASDGVASAYLTNTKCVNCDKQSWAYFDAPNPAWLGWFGGCGEFDCTGPNNYFIHDQDGQFTGSPSQILANNSIIGNGETACTSIPEINGHHCLFEELAVMQYESIAPDFNSRIMWPVFLKYDGGNWTSKTNGWREWEWNGPEPMNLRLARFWSVVKLHKHYNLTYASMPPKDTRFQLQKRLMPNGNPNDWVIIRIYYPLPNSLEILVTDNAGTNRVIKPYPSVQNAWENLEDHTSTCGANNFYFNNGTIEFVLNGVNSCQVRVTLSNYIQLTAKLSVSVADFYTNNGPTTFLTNICAFLGIDTGRLKIVSVRSGSTDVTVYITPEPVSTNSTTATDPASSAASLASMAASISSGLSTSSLIVGFPVITYDTSVVVFNADGTVYTPSSSSKSSQSYFTVLVTVVPISFVIIGVVVFICVRRMRSKIYTHEVLGMNSSQVDITEKKEDATMNLDNNHEKYQMEILQM